MNRRHDYQLLQDKSSILYSHTIRQPLSRALPRIPLRFSPWPRDSLTVGRGAITSTPLLLLRSNATAATTTTPLPIASVSASSSSQYETRENTPPSPPVPHSVPPPFSPLSSPSIRRVFVAREQKQRDILENEVPFSKRVHIVGFSSQAKFLAHALASVPDVPVNIMAHHRDVQRQWEEEYRRLNLYNRAGRHVSSVAIPCPERIPPPGRQYSRAINDDDFLDNVIVDTATVAVVPTLYTLRSRVDRRTTICLMHPGLGLVEQIKEEIFKDPLERPNLIIAHRTHQIGKVHDSLYSMRQKKSGFLHLCGMPKFDDPQLNESPVAREGLERSQHFIQLLASAKTLNAVGLPWVRFLSWKLPTVIFSSLADTISIILGCRYDQLFSNPHARAMWDQLVDEMLALVSQFPELQEVPYIKDTYMRQSFRNKLEVYLRANGTQVSPWVKQVRMGAAPPVEYFNGYFVQRARDLGLDYKHYKHSHMAEEAVKARVNARRWELKIGLARALPYMADSDTIGGGQAAPSLEDLLELDHEPI